MNFISCAQLHKDIVFWMHKLPPEISIIVGIPRSGMLVASILGLYRNLPVMSVDEYCSGLVRGVGKREGKTGYPSRAKNLVLLVDDSVYSGTTIKAARRRMVETMTNSDSGHRLVTAAMYVNINKESCVQYYARVVRCSRCFEWNLFHKPMISKACLDIDGVLTINPTFAQSTTRSLYADYLKNALPKFIPSVKIGALVTSRLESDRKLTKVWLAEHNVKYDALYMSTHKSARARRQAKDHATQKAASFKASGCSLFIESSKRQAESISRMVKLPVICTDDMILFQDGEIV